MEIYILSKMSFCIAVVEMRIIWNSLNLHEILSSLKYMQDVTLVQSFHWSHLEDLFLLLALLYKILLFFALFLS